MAFNVRQATDHDIPLLERSGLHSATVSPISSRTIRRKPLPSQLTNTKLLEDTLRPLQRQSQYSALPQLGENTLDDNHFHSDGFRADKDKPNTLEHELDRAVIIEHPSWLPYALRAPWLLGITGVGALLLALVIILHYISWKHNGLMDDSGSSELFFSWRFLPTLLAVSYVTMLMVVLDQVKRTEPFARMASSRGTTAAASILESPGAWWNALIDSFPRKKNNSFLSGTMFCAALAYVLGLFVISPFSSALLISKSVSRTTPTQFSTVSFGIDSPLQLNMSSVDYFQTIGHILQNVTTSPWTSDDYVVVPFWPSNSDRPSGSRFSAAADSWNAETVVLQADMVCEEMHSSNVVINYTYAMTFDNYTSYNSQNMSTNLLSTNTGCDYGFAYSEGRLGDIGAYYWSGLLNINIEGFWGYDWEYEDMDQQMLLNHSSQCEGGEVLTFIPDVNSTFKLSGFLCQPSYYQARIPVTVAFDANSTLITFDQANFQRLRQPIDSSAMNVSAFEESFLSSRWNGFLKAPDSDIRPEIGGPANLLGALYDFKPPSMIADERLITRAKQIRQRSFGQVLQSSLQNISSVTQFSGEAVTNQQRIVVVGVTAFILEIVSAIITCLLVSTFWLSRLPRRSLGLSQDPAFSNTIASLVSSQPETSLQLQKISHLERTQMKHALQSQTCRVSHNALYLDDLTTIKETVFHEDAQRAKASTTQQWAPKILAAWVIVALTFSLLSIMVTIAVLYGYSLKHGLSQSAFVYHINLGKDQNSIGTIAPYSIIPTLLAVVVGLWWGAMEGVFRVVQPFLAMAKRPTTSGQGSGLSYQSSYLAWAATRAAIRSQWLLALVCVGAFLSQILTISMSALWQRVPYRSESNVTTSQPFQIREVPQLYFGGGYMIDPKQAILTEVFSNLTTNWMYSAILQLTLNASEPEWSSDGWSFVPVSTPTMDSSAAQNVSSNNVNDSADQISAEMTVVVPAVRGRLECSPAAVDFDSRYYARQFNFSSWNASSRSLPGSFGYELGCTGTYLTMANIINFTPNMTAVDAGDYCSHIGGTTSFITSGNPLTCCPADENGLPEMTYHGHWTPVLMDGDQLFSSSTYNFTVKWIWGPSPATYTGRYGSQENFPELIWPEPPQLKMLNCNPVIETAHSEVTVDIATKQVQKYSILDIPSPHPVAWTDNYVGHDYPDTIDHTQGLNYTISFGAMFISALLSAAQVGRLRGTLSTTYVFSEDSEDRTFTFHEPGLSVDYMSYAMLSLAQNNFESLLNYATMEELAGKVFSTFFQHFASSNVPLNGSGGWVYQKSSEALPADLAAPLYPFNTTQRAPAKVSVAADATISAILSEPIDVLRMSPTAVWLCIIILSWLIITSIMVLVLKNRYFSPLLRGADTIADVAIMVAGSTRYLELARQKGASGLRADKGFKTQLGWFRTNTGEIKWGIELADDEAVEFLSDEEVRRLTQDISRQKEPEISVATGIDSHH